MLYSYIYPAKTLDKDRWTIKLPLHSLRSFLGSRIFIVNGYFYPGAAGIFS